LFLPPYSPDFTPVEQACSKLKAYYGDVLPAPVEAREEAVRLAIAASTHDAAVAWCAHVG
jgi:transposase